MKTRNADRLEHRALHILGPAANAAPHRHDDPGKPGCAAENSIQHAYRGIGAHSAALEGLASPDEPAQSRYRRSTPRRSQAASSRGLPRRGPSLRWGPRVRRRGGTATSVAPIAARGAASTPLCPARSGRTPMMRLAVCIGVSTCSHTAAATRPNANPATPATSAARKVEETNRTRSNAVTSMDHVAASGAGSVKRLRCISASGACRLVGRSRFPRSLVLSPVECGQARTRT